VSLEYRDFRCCENGHLIDDETVAEMGHPVVVVRLDVGHPSYLLNKFFNHNQVALHPIFLIL
jgi:hypothetical protein